MDKPRPIEARWQDGEFLRAVEYFKQRGRTTPLVREIGAQMLRDRTDDIKTMRGRLLHRAGVNLGFITIENAELLEVGTRLETAGHLKIEQEADLLARLASSPAEYFVRLLPADAETA
jgi:hypothetical protein